MLRRSRSQKWLLVSAITASTFSMASVAMAHAPLRGTSPLANQNLKKAPVAVELLAGESGLGTNPDDYITVLDASGANHASILTTSAQGDFSRISAPVSSMNIGWYAVHWNVLSDDGHPMGGESGGWWAFGVNGKTVKAATRKMVLTNPMKPSGVPTLMSASINGLRVGLRAFTAKVSWGTISSVKWTVMNSPIAQHQGATFSWPVSCVKKTRICTANGILPFVANYRVDVQISAKTKEGQLTSVWSASATPAG